MRKSNNKLVTKGLAFLENVAQRKANARCSGVLYEPKVPKKLSASKRALSLALAVLIAASCVMSGGVEKFYADEWDRPWSISVVNPVAVNVAKVNMARSDETYTWTVGRVNAPSGYAVHNLVPYGCTVTMDYGYNNQISGLGKKTFTADNFSNTFSDKYAVFAVELNYDSLPTSTSGRITLPSK